MKKIILIIMVLMSLSIFGCKSENAEIPKAPLLMNEHEYKVIPDAEFSDLTFMVASDFHILSGELYNEGEAFKKLVESSRGQMQYQGIEILDEFTRNVINEKPDFLMLTGDLTLNGEKQSHLDFAEKLNEIEEAGIDVYVLPGNHDINNVYARSYFDDKQKVVDYVSFIEFSSIYGEFGLKESIMMDKETFSYVAEVSDNVWLLMIDSNIYNDNVTLRYPESGGKLKTRQAEWFDKVIKEAEKQDKRVILGMHHNMLPHADVDPFYLSDFMIAGSNSGMPEYLASKNISVVFSGHIHTHDIAGKRYEDNFLYDITTGSLMVYPHNYRICKLSKNADLEISTKNITELEGDYKGGIGFYEFSKEQAYDISNRGFFKPEGVSKKDAEKMSAFGNKVANAYFEGTDNKILEDKKNKEAYRLWQLQAEKGADRRADMILGMSIDTEPVDREIRINLNTGFWEKIIED
jgi:3',5'-cyclic AMP phosphodiesterase CpdA